MGSQPYTDEDRAEIRKTASVLKSKFDVWETNKDGRVLILVNGKPEIVKRSQLSFALLLYPDKKNPQPQISKWLRGESHIPADKLDEIVKIFNNDGIPTTKQEFKVLDDEALNYNSEAVNNWIKKHYFEREKELSEAFFNSLRLFMKFLKTIPEYDNLFPLWAPIKIDSTNYKDKDKVHKIWNDSCGIKYPIFIRDSYDSLPDFAPSDYKEFQVNKGKDGIKTLQDPDIEFITNVMDEVITVIKHIFERHREELNKVALNASFSLFCHDTMDLEYANRDELIQEQKNLFKKSYFDFEREMMFIDPDYLRYYLQRGTDEAFFARDEKDVFIEGGDDSNDQ